jgi:hypothetical protein
LYNWNVNIFHLAAKGYRLQQVAFPQTSGFNLHGETSWGANRKTCQLVLF